MTAIEEMYKVYGVKPLKQYTSCAWNSAENCPYSKDGNCIENCTQLFIVYEEYPPFTAEKQLELIKLVLGIEDSNLYIYKNSRFYVFELSDYDRFALDFERIVVRVESKNFEIGLAKFISKLSDYLDHAKVKEILEG